MGTSCSKPTAAKPTAAKPMAASPVVASTPNGQLGEISILIEQINIIEGSDVRLLKRTLRRNSLLLKKRIAFYDGRLEKVDPSDPRVKTYLAERTRATQLLTTVCRMQAALEYMA